jgi:hypothetical protein
MVPGIEPKVFLLQTLPRLEGREDRKRKKSQ